MSAENERGGPDVTPDRPTAQAAPATSNTSKNTSSGVEVAIRNAEPGFIDAGLDLIEMQTQDGSITCGCRITEHSWIGEADHSSRWGALFAIAARRGLIERVGYHVAGRSSRHAGVHAVWRAREVVRSLPPADLDAYRSAAAAGLGVFAGGHFTAHPGFEAQAQAFVAGDRR